MVRDGCVLLWVPAARNMDPRLASNVDPRLRERLVLKAVFAEFSDEPESCRAARE